MEPSVTMKFFFPFDFTPITLLTNIHVFPTRDLPGSIMSLTFISLIRSLIELMRSNGFGIALSWSR